MVYDLSKTFDVQRVRVYLEKLIEKGAKVVLSEQRKKRTLSQNGLFHAWIKVFAEHIGDADLEDVKRDVKRTLLGLRETANRFTSEIQLEDYRTSKMDTKELSSFMDRFKAWAQTEYGCYLPYVGDAGYEDMIKEYN